MMYVTLRHPKKSWQAHYEIAYLAPYVCRPVSYGCRHERIVSDEWHTLTAYSPRLFNEIYQVDSLDGDHASAHFIRLERMDPLQPRPLDPMRLPA
jgi:hypothetical protein